MSTNGIEVDVAADLQQIRIFVDEDRLEAPLEEMPHLAMPAVVGLRVDAIDLSHQPGQVRAAGMQDQMIMVAHQAIGQCTGIEAVKGCSNHVQKCPPVLVVVEDRLAPVAPRGNVVNRSGKFDAQGAGHDSC